MSLLLNYSILLFSTWLKSNICTAGAPWVPVPTFWCAGRKMWSASLCYCHQWQAACRWHPGSKEQEALRLLWSTWGAAPTRNLQAKTNTLSGSWISWRLSPPRTISCVVLQQQFLPSPLNAAQHVETVAEAGGEGDVMGQRHAESKVRERQRGHEPGRWMTVNPEGVRVVVFSQRGCRRAAGGWVTNLQVSSQGSYRSTAL